MSASEQPQSAGEWLTDNVDPAEAARYAALASTWWDARGPFWPLHRLNALRTDYLRHELSRLFERNAHDAQPLSGLKMLDIGCGGGILSESMARLGADVHGIDVVARNVAIARQHALEGDLTVRYELASAEQLASRAPRYDVVLNMEVVEHVPDVTAFMQACSALVAPGGVMSVATINRTMLSWLFAIVGAEYVLRWLPRGTHQWRRFVTPEEIERELEAAHFEICARAGVRVNPITRGFALQRSMQVNYMLLARLERGRQGASRMRGAPEEPATGQPTTGATNK